MKIVAKKKRKKAAEYGVRSPARILPAIHVPPQNVTDPRSLKYNIVFDDISLHCFPEVT